MQDRAQRALSPAEWRCQPVLPRPPGRHRGCCSMRPPRQVERGPPRRGEASTPQAALASLLGFGALTREEGLSTQEEQEERRTRPGAGQAGPWAWTLAGVSQARGSPACAGPPGGR